MDVHYTNLLITKEREELYIPGRGGGGKSLGVGVKSLGGRTNNKPTKKI